MWDFNRCNAATRAPSKQNITRALGFAADIAVTEPEYFQSLHGVGEFVFGRVAQRPSTTKHAHTANTCSRTHETSAQRGMSFALMFTAPLCLPENLLTNATLRVDERVRWFLDRKSILPHSERPLSRVAVSSRCRRARTRPQSGARVAGRFQGGRLGSLDPLAARSARPSISHLVRVGQHESGAAPAA